MTTDVKISLFAFLFLFLGLFFIFNGSAFPTWFNYKFQEITHLFQSELFRSPKFLTKIPNVEENKIDSSMDNFLFPSFSPTEIENIVLPSIPEEANEVNIIELPKFNIKAPIITVKTPDLDLIYKELKKGVVLYPGSTNPSQGYSIIIGHSSQYPWEKGNYKSVFSLLNELDTGDQIYIFWEQQPLVFEFVDKKIFIPWPKGSETTETIFPPSNEETILVLQSCWPVGVASKRVAVKMVLVK